MDQLPALGTKCIADTVPGTSAAYDRLLVANAGAIRSTPVKTFSYGPHARQQLDVYTPKDGSAAAATAPSSSPSSPILIFLHGGGFVNGAKNMPRGAGLAFANLGHFFAERHGFTVVVPNYRLLSHGARYPSGGEDVSLVVEWIAEHLGAGAAAAASPPRKLFLAGASAGGVHAATFLFAPEFAATRRRVTKQAGESGVELGGVVGISVPFDLDSALEDRRRANEAYYGSLERVPQLCPTGLLRRAAPVHLTELRNVRFLLASEELAPVEDNVDPAGFLAAWQEGGGGGGGGGGHYKPDTLFLRGHNHISPPLSLGTAVEREEKWGHDVANWLKRIA